MISIDTMRLMARYNDWQNRSLLREATELGDGLRRLPRGAFFSSIHGTLSHLLWADGIWMHRFTRSPKPSGGVAESAHLYPHWDDLVAARHALDTAIIGWGESVTADWLSSSTTWMSAAAGREMNKPNWFLALHFFNHQTHHRGQVHAMLTAAGGRPDDTDLFLMPHAAGL